MKTIFRIVTLLAAVCAVSIANAKTSKYELININSNSTLTLPGLELNNITSAILTVTKNAPNFEPNLVSLELNFPNADKLTATNFKSADGYKYRAIVPDTWIYREVIVDIRDFRVDNPLSIEVRIADRTNYINPLSNGQAPFSSPLINVLGELNEITPTRIIDQQALTVAGKKLTLSLRDRVLFRVHEPLQKFSIDAVWAGKGAKTLSVPADVPSDAVDTLDVIALVIDENGNDPMLSIKFKESHGFEITSQMVRLHDLLDQAYGPTPWPPL